MQTPSNFNRQRTRGALLLFIGLALLSAVSGCGRFVPKTTALKTIHQSYRTEFQRFLQVSLPVPQADGTSGPLKGTADQPAFAETLQEIREYRLKYGEASKEAAHLTVLEGMIYLQSGQSGMARVLLPAIRDAKQKLGAGNGTATRDQLLAANFEALIDGWDTIKKNRALLDDAKILAGAADSIKSSLESLGGAKRAQPEVDEGAVYLATTGAIFYTWVAKTQSEDKSCWCRKGRNLIAPYLTPSEKETAQSVDFQNVPSGRVRYISWYGALAKCGGTQNEAATCAVP